MIKIKIKRSSTADTRTCDVTKVSKEELLASTISHINDVNAVMNMFAEEIKLRGRIHDYTKISHIDMFYEDFKTNFETEDWYTMHKYEERHHLQAWDGVSNDVDLVDVLECVIDCVTAGLARSGEFKKMAIPADVLVLAVNNTAKKIIDNIEIED